MPMLEGRVEHVIGVDTHRDSHVAAELDPTGGLVAQVEIPSSQQGYAQLLHFAAEWATGRRCWALQVTRAGAVKVAADARHLKALLVTAPEPLRTALRGGPGCGRRVRARHSPLSHPIRWSTVRALPATAERALAAHQEARQFGKELGTLARAVAPALLAQRGVGPVTGPRC